MVLDRETGDLDLDLSTGRTCMIVTSLSIQPQLIQRIRELQKSEPNLKKTFNSLDSMPDFLVRAVRTSFQREDLDST